MTTNNENDYPDDLPEALPDGCTPIGKGTIDGREMNIVLAPGALDSFTGTQEELAELMTEIQRMFASGDAFEKMTPLEGEALREFEEHVARQAGNTRQ